MTDTVAQVGASDAINDVLVLRDDQKSPQLPLLVVPHPSQPNVVHPTSLPASRALLATKLQSRASSRAALVAASGLDGNRDGAEIMYSFPEHKAQVEKVIGDLTKILQYKLRTHHDGIVNPRRLGGGAIPQAVLQKSPELQLLISQVGQLQEMYEQQRSSNSQMTIRLDREKTEKLEELKKAKEKHDPKKRDIALKVLVQKIGETDVAIASAEEENQLLVTYIDQAVKTLKQTRKASIKKLTFSVKKIIKLRQMISARKPEVSSASELTEQLAESAKTLAEGHARFKAEVKAEKEKQRKAASRAKKQALSDLASPLSPRSAVRMAMDQVVQDDDETLDVKARVATQLARAPQVAGLRTTGLFTDEEILEESSVDNTSVESSKGELENDTVGEYESGLDGKHDDKRTETKRGQENLSPANSARSMTGVDGDASKRQRHDESKPGHLGIRKMHKTPSDVQERETKLQQHTEISIPHLITPSSSSAMLEPKPKTSLEKTLSSGNFGSSVQKVSPSSAKRGAIPSFGTSLPGVDQDLLTNLLNQHQARTAEKEKRKESKAAASAKLLTDWVSPDSKPTSPHSQSKAWKIIEAHLEGKGSGLAKTSASSTSAGAAVEPEGPIGTADRFGRIARPIFCSMERHKTLEQMNKQLRQLVDGIQSLRRRYTLLEKRQYEMHTQLTARPAPAKGGKKEGRKKKQQSSSGELTPLPSSSSSGSSSPSGSDIGSEDEHVLAAVLGVGKPPPTAGNFITHDFSGKRKSGMTKATKELIETQLIDADEKLEQAQLICSTWRMEVKLHDREVGQIRVFVTNEVKVALEESFGVHERLQQAIEKRNQLVMQFFEFEQQKELAALQNQKLEASFMMRTVTSQHVAQKILQEKYAQDYDFKDFINTNDINKRAVAVQNNLEVDMLPQQIRRLIVLGNQEEKFRDHIDQLEQLVAMLSNFNEMMSAELACANCNQIGHLSFIFWPCGHNFCQPCSKSSVDEANVYHCYVCGAMSAESAMTNQMCNALLGRWYFKLSGFNDLNTSLRAMQNQMESLSANKVIELVDDAMLQMEIAAEKGYST